MRMIVTGVRDGKSSVVEETDIAPGTGELSTRTLVDLPLQSLPPRPSGKGEFLNIPLQQGVLRWMWVRFPANQLRRVHHTDTIDCHTIVEGMIELLLDDGAHPLRPGDCAMVTGVDHGWRTGPEGCLVSMFLLATPPPI